MALTDWLVAAEHGVIVHLADPWFACRYAPDAAAAGDFAGLTVDTGDRFFCDFRWRDGLPSEPALRALCAQAAEEIRRFTHRRP